MSEFDSRDAMLASIGRKYTVLFPDGREIAIDPDNVNEARSVLSSLGDPALESYVLSEEMGFSSGAIPKSIDAMRRLELVDYEPASDAGHFRFYPEGSMVMDLLINWAEDIAISRFGAMKIETPILYDWSQKDIREQGESFHERHYIVRGGRSGKKEWVLRFAGDFGLFRMMRDVNLSYRNLPMRIYELSKSFRYEKRGELSGLKRLRGFTMPDIHSFTGGLEDGWKEYTELYMHYDSFARMGDVEYAIVFRVVEDFYSENRERIVEMLKHSGRPAFVELLSGPKHYWVIKNEFQGIDASGGSCQLSTVQLDLVDSGRYGITYVDRDGHDKGCVICHSSIGSIERWLYMIIESALKRKSPALPLWLSPTQVRIVPVSSSFIDDAVRLHDFLSGSGIRCDVDDRDITMQKKVMDVQKKWVPVMVVLGEKERGSGMLSVSLRESGERKSMGRDDLAQMLNDSMKGMPGMELRVPFLLSRRPRFYG